MFEIFSLKEGEVTPGVNHIAFLVDDIEGTYEDLTKKGVRFTTKINQSWARRKLAFLADPDGIVLQLVENPWLV